MQLFGWTLLQTLILHFVLKLSSVKALSGYNIRDAREDEYPFVVSIGFAHQFYYGDEKHICTGALISDVHVLTAAHCLQPPTPEAVQVTIGSVDLREGQPILASKWITYKDWAKTTLFPYKSGMNDIAIIKLSKAVDQTIIRSAKLWWGKKSEFYGKNASVVGWGHTNDAQNASQILKTAATRIISTKQCKQTVQKIDPVNYLTLPRHMYTNAEPYVRLEPGDSGGPLIYGLNILVGVNTGMAPKTSCVYLCSKDVLNECRVNVHISIAAYRSFIEDCLINF